jgi:flagellar biosynthesis protein FlhF
MRLKSYFAVNVAAALEMARRELGPEAMLVHSRKAPPEARHLGEWEVVMALPPPQPAADGSLPMPAPTTSTPSSQADGAQFSSELAAMRAQMERMASAVTRSNALAATHYPNTPELAEIFASLIDSGVGAELAHDVLNRLRSAAPNAQSLSRALSAEIARRVACNAQLGGLGARPRMVALVGPCGCGKTTTLVKLAVRYGISARRPTQLISVDNYRVASVEQLRSYAAILGLGFQALDTTRTLAQALEEHSRKDLILIDTPGHGFNDLAEAADLARYLAGRPDIETHLVLSASMKSADLTRVVDRFEIFRPQRLLFTKLDETETFGPILNEAARSGKPVSFLTAGQRVPEDLEPATQERIVNLILARGARLAAAAAA